MPTLEVNKLKKEYTLGTAGKLSLFNNLTFKFADSESFLTILAPFGSGKTTLLKIISGLETVSEGEILLNGKNYSLADTKIIYIPEKSSSLPWLSVMENLTFAVKGGNSSHYENILKLIGLEAYSDHYPDNGSIGFRFRIAVGRAIALNPAFILIDDSMKLVDSETKPEIYSMLRKIASETGIKFLIATTDISEAVSLADRIIILRKRPTEIAGEYLVNKNRDKKDLLEFLNSTLLQNEFKESINFTI